MMRAVILAGLTTVAFGLLYQVSIRLVAIAAIIGATGWAVYAGLSGSMPGHALWAEFVGALVVGGLAEIAAWRGHEPAIVFAVPAIIPFVPGDLFYQSMLSFLRNHFLIGLKYGFRALVLAGALSVGLAMATAVTRPLLRRAPLGQRDSGRGGTWGR